MPKNFVFYNPEHHQQIISLLETQKPAAIITATERKPEQVGALYPFPLIVDGDFDIPSVYCRDSVGRALARNQGELFRLKIDTRRLTSSANNVIAQLNQDTSKKIVITAHIDGYEDTPGASDNASGTVVLLLLAEMFSSYRGVHCIEIAALNEEDHYSAGGQLDYINRYGKEFNRIVDAINMDGIGYQKGRSSYSFYECSPEFEQKAKAIFQGFGGLVQGEQWFSGDAACFLSFFVALVFFRYDGESRPTHLPLTRADGQRHRPVGLDDHEIKRPSDRWFSGLSQVVERRFLGRDGQIHYKTRVEKILTEMLPDCQGVRSVGLCLADGGEVRDDRVIAACDGNNTLCHLLMHGTLPG